LQYDAFGRTSAFVNNGAVVGNYYSNALNQRVAKAAGTWSLYVYGPSGELLYEAGPTPTAYAWLGGEMLGVSRNGSFYASHNECGVGMRGRVSSFKSRACECKASLAAGSSLVCCPQLRRSLSRAEDRDAVELLQHEQIVVARDDDIGLRGDGQREHRIVIGIAAHRLGQRWRLDHLGELPHLGQRLLTRSVRALEDRVELGSSQHVGQLRQQRRGC
jgi:hypothetical protein